MSSRGTSIASKGGYVLYHWVGDEVNDGTKWEKKEYSIESKAVGSHIWQGNDHDEAMQQLHDAPPLRRVTVEFDIFVPEDVSEDRLQDWLEFELGCNGSLSAGPLDNRGLNADSVSVGRLDDPDTHVHVFKKRGE